MEKKEFLYVMDHCQSKIYKIENPDQELTTDQILERYGLKLNQCSVMFCSEDLEIESIDKIS